MDEETRGRLEAIENRLILLESIVLGPHDEDFDLDPIERQHREFKQRVRARREAS